MFGYFAYLHSGTSYKLCIDTLWKAAYYCRGAYILSIDSPQTWPISSARIRPLFGFLPCHSGPEIWAGNLTIKSVNFGGGFNDMC